jgi:hypothetical protein
MFSFVNHTYHLILPFDCNIAALLCHEPVTFRIVTLPEQLEATLSKSVFIILGPVAIVFQKYVKSSCLLSMGQDSHKNTGCGFKYWYMLLFYCGKVKMVGTIEWFYGISCILWSRMGLLNESFIFLFSFVFGFFRFVYWLLFRLLFFFYLNICNLMKVLV